MQEKEHHFLNDNTQDKDSMTGTDTGVKDQRLDLFLASLLMLFLELACIRWIPANVRMLSFFSNFVLLACFLGMSIGFLLTAKKFRFFTLTPYFILIIAIIFSLVQLKIQFDPGTARQQIYYGAEIKAAYQHVPFLIVLAMAISLISVIFIGIGQRVGQLFEGMAPLQAYILNIAGSIAGTLLFALFSWCTQPPVSWLAFAFIIMLFLLRKSSLKSVIPILIVLCVTLFLVNRGSGNTVWSPYSKITIIKVNENNAGLLVNGLTHQYVMNRRELVKIGYQLPYLLKLRSAGPGISDVLIIGSGMGNDLSHALYCGAAHVDAVEIDPVIARAGMQLHPNKPYSDPRVSLHVMDGRQFLNRTDKKYDLIIYALVDSLSLFSSFSSVRMENFLFTDQAFREARSHLKDDGVLIIYNYFRRGWLAEKVARTLESAFGRDPLVVTFPHMPRIAQEDDISVSPLVMFIAGDTEPIRKSFRQSPDGLFIQWTAPFEKNLAVNGFVTRTAVIGETYMPAGLTELEGSPPRSNMIPSDQWPFPYLRKPEIPLHYFKGVALLLVLSFVLVLCAAGREIRSWSLHYFFLGAGFMLLETVGVIKFSQLYGSTWLNNVVVFFTILVLILVANLYMLRKGSVPIKAVYLILLGALSINFFITPSLFLRSGDFLKYTIPPLVLFIPMFFAGLIFANSFKNETSPQSALASNILGSMAGGVLEYLSMYMGYTPLLAVIGLCYILSWLFMRKRL